MLVGKLADPEDLAQVLRLVGEVIGIGVLLMGSEAQKFLAHIGKNIVVDLVGGDGVDGGDAAQVLEVQTGGFVIMAVIAPTGGIALFLGDVVITADGAADGGVQSAPGEESMVSGFRLWRSRKA